MTEESYQKLDNLFKEIKLCILEVRKNDPENGNKLKDLVGQLDLWIDSLVGDSVRLRNIEAELEKRRELAKNLIGSLEKER